MKIAVIGKNVQSGSFIAHIAVESTLLGHSAEAFELRADLEPRSGKAAKVAAALRTQAGQFSRRSARLVYRKLLLKLKAFKPDLVITTLGRIGSEEISSWRAAVPTAQVVLWFPDAISNFGNQRAFSAGLDRIYTKDPYLVDRLRDCGISEVRYLAEGAPTEAAEWGHRNLGKYRTDTIAMVGNIYPSRVRFLEQLVGKHAVDIYGTITAKDLPSPVAARFTGKYLRSEEKYEVFRAARGVLNNLHYAEVDSVNYRLFEAAACGGVVLTDDLSQVRRYFEPGSELLVFKGAGDLIQQMNEVTTQELDALAQAGHRRVLRDHLIQHRLVEMFADLGY